MGGGGGWAEDMEGRSVLSLTLVYIIFLDCSNQPASQPASQLRHRPRQPQVRFFHYQKRVREGGGEWNHQGTRVFFIFFPDSGCLSRVKQNSKLFEF